VRILVYRSKVASRINAANKSNDISNYVSNSLAKSLPWTRFMKVLVLDDHPLFSEALCVALQRMSPESSVLAFSNVDQAEQALLTSGPFDVALVDYQLPGGSRGAGVKKLLSLSNSPPILVISGSASSAEITELLRLGAKGFVPKSEGGRVIAAATQLVAAGGTYLPSDFSRTDNAETGTSGGSVGNTDFTQRELDIIGLLKSGKSNKDIARALSIELPTVKQYVHRVFTKLGVNTRSQALIKLLDRT
jgi:DNA-binding NarL/FixJ family response regulator